MQSALDWETEDDWDELQQAGQIDQGKWRHWQALLLKRMLEEQDRLRPSQYGEVAEMEEFEYRQLLSHVIRNTEEIPAIHHVELIRQFLDYAYRMGPLQPLWERPAVTDIQVFVPFDERDEQIISYTEGRVRKIYKEQQFQSYEKVLDWINHHLSRLNLRYDPAKVFVHGTFPQGERINVISGPCGYSKFNVVTKQYRFVKAMIISIRKFPNAFTMEELTEQNPSQHKPISFHHANLVEMPDYRKFDRKPVYTRFGGNGRIADQATMDYLAIMVRLGKNHLISGGTGAGKTTVANSLTGAIPRGTLLLVLEESPEMQPQVQDHVIRIYSRPGVFDLKDALENAMRMFPDRIFVQEIRNHDAYVFLDAIQTDHDGSSTTIHASSCQAALDRTIELAAGHPLRPDRQMLQSMLRDRLDVVMHCNRASGDRFIDHVCEIQKNGKLRTVSKFVQVGIEKETGLPAGYFEFHGPGDEFLEEMMVKGIPVPRSWKWGIKP